MVKFLPREAWRYAILLIVLFAIAAVTVREILQYLGTRLAPQHFQVVTVLMFALTLGFMLIAGAFGLWAIRFSSEAESRRRLGRFVDAMDYLSDGIVTVDRDSRIAGSNPAAATLLNMTPVRNAPLSDTLPFLPPESVRRLADRSQPHEVECRVDAGDQPRMLRFRSQPSEDLTLLFITDVTSLVAQVEHTRQVARLQLIGQIARGVAHDFNNLLCVISGHAAILKHAPPGSPQMAKSLDQIVQGTEKGSAMAGHLLDLAHLALPIQPTPVAHDYVDRAVQMLRDSLSDKWRVETDISPLPMVALTGIQIEQIVLNLGLLSADTLPDPGTVNIVARQPEKRGLFDVGGRYAAVIILSVAPGAAADSAALETVPSETSRESGVILSVIRSMVEEAGGRLDALSTADGSRVYRVALPHGQVQKSGKAEDDKTAEFGTYVAHWSVLVATAGANRHMADVLARLKALAVNVIAVQDVVAALGQVEATPSLDAIIMEKGLLRQEAEGLIRAIIKLRPAAGLVILSEDPTGEPKSLRADVVYAPMHADSDGIMLALIEAKSLAVRRKHAKPAADA